MSNKNATSYDAVDIIEQALRDEVVLTGGYLRLRPATDNEIALKVVDALELAGWEIIRKGRLSGP